ncbi:MAG TPA: hypothetical protein VLV83_00150 [Acidobacteriota bacterium]|nr:hypothetical protein [Acidobacteriota bacterium]
MLFSLLASPWAGLWRLQPLPRSNEGPHLYIHQDGTVEMFDIDWSPFDIHETRLGDDEIFVRFTLEAHTKMRRLTLRRSESGLEGTLEILAGGGQFPMQQQASAIRVADRMPESPQKWIADIRSEERIDALGFLLEKAPRGSFDDFLKFWNETYEPRYYPMMALVMYGYENDPQVRLDRIRKVFQQLPAYEEEAQERAERVESALSEAAQSQRALAAQLKRGLCKVILPSFGSPGVEMHPVATVRLERKPGQKICCGSRGYTIENFAYISLPPPSAPEESETAERKQASN